jgi:cytochrome c oxidase cbb3-type subunit 3
MSDTNRELGHADEADGIEEYDNALPTWWLGLFIGCVIWAAFYAVDYHYGRKRSQTGEYKDEMAAAAATWKQLEVKAWAPTGNLLVDAGHDVYMTNCVGCHGATAAGGVGPNLTDATWIHGGTLAAITKTVTEGVPAKGMLTWGPILGPEKVAQVSAYVHALGGGEGPGADATPVPATDPAGAPDVVTPAPSAEGAK